MTGQLQIEYLKDKAKKLRRDIVSMIHQSGTPGHYGGSLSCAEILVCLFLETMRHQPQNPHWESRDRFILSKGHAAPALYAVLAECGYFPKGQFVGFKKLGGTLQGHPDMKLTPGVEMSTGSLGQGLSVGVGMALASRLDRQDNRVYVLLGDGELDEGSVWEAAMAAAHFGLDHLTAIVDRNRLQISGPTERTMKLEPLGGKWASFGWEVANTNGHDIPQILSALNWALRVEGKPSVIIADTTKGKGIPFMENTEGSHSAMLTDKQFAEAGEVL
jgi:transketolase